MADTPDEQRGVLPTSRRRFLGAAALTGAVATVGAFSARSQDGTQPDELHPVYGFTAASGDVPPPVEPDHEVTLDIRPVEGRELPEFPFDPVGLAVEAGDVVQFTNALGAHSVTAYHPELERTQRVPDGVPPFSSPLLATGAYWLYRFEQPGVHDVYCIPHEEFGMVARIVVQEPTGTVTGTGTEAGTAGSPTATETAGRTDTGTAGSPTTTAGETTDTATAGAGASQETATATGTEAATPGTETGTPGTPAGTSTPTPEPGFELPEFPPTEAAQRVFDDPAITPENIVEQGTVARADLSLEARGLATTQQRFTARLSGENEVPPVESEASGEAMFRLTPESSLEFEVFVNSIEEATQAHIHEGAAGENGPIRYTLAEYTEEVDGSGEGQPRTVLPDNVLVIEGTVEDVDPSLFESPENLYVNVHTVANPGGEIRGQLMRMDSEPTETPDGTPTETPSDETSTETETGTEAETETG